MRAWVKKRPARSGFRRASSVVLTVLVFICAANMNPVSSQSDVHRPPITKYEDEESQEPDEDNGSNVNISAILDSLGKNYDKRIRPNFGGPPVEVGVTMYVLSISSLSEVKMDFTLDFYFRQFWTDPRLAYKKQKGVGTLSVGSEFIKNIWVPDTFFVNEKHSYFHVATTSNEFIRIHHTGFITRSMRLTVTAACPMDLRYFPMDSQLCQIEIESCTKAFWRMPKLLSNIDNTKMKKQKVRTRCMEQQHQKLLSDLAVGYTMRDIKYKWNEGINSVGISSEVSLPQFKVLGHRQRSMEISLSTGNYSRLACEIQFVRSMGYYMIQIYIPSGLIVVISWVSFWLNRNATPARVSLGVTTVLTMTTLMSSTNSALPKISYVKSIDVYLGTCFIMVFASLLEYATVGYMTKRISLRNLAQIAILKRRKRVAAVTAARLPRLQLSADVAGPSVAGPSTAGSSSRSALNLPMPGDAGYRPNVPRHGILETAFNGSQATETVPIPLQLFDEEGDLIDSLTTTNKIFGVAPADIDKYSRIIFPVCFLSFNLTYWVIYSQVSVVVADDLVLLNGGK